MKSNHPTCLITFLLSLLLSSAVPCLATSFTADLAQSERGKMHTAKFYFQDHRYRMDMVEDGKSLFILVDRKTGKTRIVVPSEKAYREIANSNMQSLIKNPFEAYQYMLKRYKVRSTGQETVHGLTCEKQVISMQGKDVMTAWVTKKYAFPLKIINSVNRYTAELQNIKEKRLTTDLFTVPAGFKPAQGMSVPLPKWAQDIPGSPILKAPFSTDLSAKQIIRVKPVNGFYIKFNISNLLNKPCRFTAVAFKNGKPVRDPSYKTYNVSRSGQGLATTNKAQPGQADEIVVRVARGKVKIHAELEEAPPEGVRLKKFCIKASQGKELDVNYRKALHLILQDDPADGKASQGTLTVFGTVAQDVGNGTTVYQKKRLESIPFRLGNGKSRMWPFPRDREVGVIGINVTKGVLNVRIEQPTRAGSTPPSWANASQKAEKKLPAPTARGGQKAASPNVIFILDASGSMWGQISGKPKIQIAKGAMNDLIDHLPSGMRVGLMAYGHRRKGDCHDIEMLVPVGKLSPSRLKAKINAINPKGKTPLSAAVRQASEKLHYTAKRATVVLVSDGLETCGGNPCKLAERLAMSGVDFTVHVIGFDLSKQEQRRLRCLADKTGGLFLAAANATTLRNALFTTIKKVQAPPPPVKKRPGKAKLKCPATVPAGAAFKVTWKGPGSRRDFISIAEKSSRDLRYVDYAYIENRNPLRMIAPGYPGSYELRYVHGHSHQVIGRTDIKVTPVTAHITAPPSGVVATKIDVQWEGPGYKDDYISIGKPDQAPGHYSYYESIAAGNPLRLQAPADPGVYEIRYIMAKGRKILANTSISIKKP